MIEFDPRVVAKLGTPLRAGANERRFNCPFCPPTRPDKKHHLYFNIQTGLWTCHRCGAKGARRHFYELLGIPYGGDHPAPTPDQFDGLIDTLRRSCGETEGVAEINPSIGMPPCQPIGPESPAAYYLLDRGLTWDDINYYNIREGLLELAERVVFLEQAGPSPDDPVVFWQARAFTEALLRDIKNYPGRADKYQSAPGVKKSMCLWNMNRIVDFTRVYITEGIFDAIAVGKQAVAGYGKDLSQDQRFRLLRANFDEYIVALDSDAMDKAVKLCEWLHNQGCRVSLVPLPPGHDPGDLGYERFHQIRPVPFDPWTATSEFLMRGRRG